MPRVPIPLVTERGRWPFAPTYAAAVNKLRPGEVLVIVLDWTGAGGPDAAEWARLQATGSPRFDPYAVPAALVGAPTLAGRAALG